jgi:hypothetical protein
VFAETHHEEYEKEKMEKKLSEQKALAKKMKA